MGVSGGIILCCSTEMRQVYIGRERGAGLKSDGRLGVGHVTTFGHVTICGHIDHKKEKIFPGKFPRSLSYIGVSRPGVPAGCNHI